MSKERFADGCHKWGWLIAILVGIAGNLLVVGVLAGQQTEKINGLGANIQAVKEDVGKRIDRLEDRLNQLKD